MTRSAKYLMLPRGQRNTKVVVKRRNYLDYLIQENGIFNSQGPDQFEFDDVTLRIRHSTITSAIGSPIQAKSLFICSALH